MPFLLMIISGTKTTGMKRQRDDLKIDFYAGGASGAPFVKVTVSDHFLR